MIQVVHLITIGKLKDSNLKSLEQEYLKRVKFNFNVHELKSFDDDKEKESKQVVQKISQIQKSSKNKIILLTESGLEFNSPDFSAWMYKINSPGLIFIIGGAAGHGQEVIKLADYKLSLSKLTFPHQFARVVLIEQLYRAETIHTDHPYHK